MAGIATLPTGMEGLYDELFRIVFEENRILPSSASRVQFSCDLQGQKLRWGIRNKGLVAMCDPLKDVCHIVFVY